MAFSGLRGWVWHRSSSGTRHKEARPRSSQPILHSVVCVHFCPLLRYDNVTPVAFPDAVAYKNLMMEFDRHKRAKKQARWSLLYLIAALPACPLARFPAWVLTSVSSQLPALFCRVLVFSHNPIYVICAAGWIYFQCNCYPTTIPLSLPAHMAPTQCNSAQH